MSEFENVRKTLDRYIEGTKRLDYDMVISAVHHDGRLFVGNSDTSKNLLLHWQSDMERHKETDRKAWYEMFQVPILAIEIEGTIAFAKLRMRAWYDFHNLVKIKDEWKIVGKVSHKITEQDNKDITEIEQLREAIETYIQGSRELDYSKMVSVVHPDARLFLGNEETSKNLYIHWKPDPVRFGTEEAKRDWYEKAIIKILSIKIEGTIANVKLQFADWYFDFHNYVKTSAGWKMVDKVSHKIE